MTILEELKQIARACKTSEEFSKRAIVLYPNVMDEAELRELYRREAHERDRKKAWELYDKTIEPALLKRADTKDLWYETWIDLEETWIDKWFASFQYMKVDDIIEVCAKYLNERERFYGSSDYIDMLNTMVKDIKFDEEDD
jgi:hypothetical protein